MKKREKISDTCIGCGKSFVTEATLVGRYKILVKSEDVWARNVWYNCPACGLKHSNIQAKITKPKR